jgi:hypothetical protein
MKFAPAIHDVDSEIHASGELPRVSYGCHLLRVRLQWRLLLIDAPLVPIIHHQLSFSFSSPASHTISSVPSTSTSHSNFASVFNDAWKLTNGGLRKASLQRWEMSDFRNQLIRNTKPALRAGAIGGNSSLRVRGFLQVSARRRYPRSPDKNAFSEHEIIERFSYRRMPLSCA